MIVFKNLFMLKHTLSRQNINCFVLFSDFYLMFYIHIIDDLFSFVVIAMNKGVKGLADKTMFCDFTPCDRGIH